VTEHASTDQAATPQQQKGRGRFIARHLLALVILGVAIVFIGENRHQVRIRALVPWVTIPLWEALAVTIVAGMLILALIQHRRHH
jgi:uncharacterized integral membrane protein